MEEVKILIVEDNIVTLGDLEMRMEQMGYRQIATAVSGAEAVEIAEKFHPHIILSDIHLGKGINGIEAVRQIKQKNDVAVIYLTAYDDDKTLAEAGITEPYAYLLKPLQERELQIALGIALYKHKIEMALKEAINAKNRFISILAHDIRNLFHLVIGFSSLLRENFEIYEPSKTKLFIDKIYDASKQTHNLLNNLLEWSLIQQNKTPFNPKLINIKNLLMETYDLLNPLALEKNITVLMDVPENLTLTADADMMKTVIRNLLNNAIKFTPAQGKIWMKAIKSENSVEIEIADNGIGMDEQTMLSLFKIGKLISHAGTNEEQGSGFGLLLIKEFVDKHGGEIKVESQLNIGSKFIVVLPA